MNHTLLILFSFFIIHSSFSQAKIDNKLTDKYIQIKGTKISLIPPKDFEKATNFIGFQQNETGSSIMLMDIPGPFKEISKGMTREGFQSKGIEVKNLEQMTINNLPAVFVTGVQTAHGIVYSKYVLAFGTDDETIMINGSFPNQQTETGKNIKAAILSAYYEEDKKVNPFESVDFEISVANSSLVFAKSVSNSLIFTVDGLLPTMASNKTTLIATKSFSEIKDADKKQFAINRLKQLPFTNIEIDTVRQVIIDKMFGFEIIATANENKTGEAGKIYQVLLFDEGIYYMLLGTTNTQYEENLADLKKVAWTFKRKQG